MESPDIFTNQSFEASEAFVRDWRSRKLFLTSVSERDEKPATLRIVAYGEGLGKKRVPRLANVPYCRMSYT